MNDEQFFLANAYLDGELTDEERRIAEADPAVMAEVETLRDLQAAVRDVPAPTGAVREASIAAAMAEFGATAAAPAEAPVVPYRPRPAYARYLAVAAAVVAVAGLGVVVSQWEFGGDDDDAAEDAGFEAAIEATGDASVDDRLDESIAASATEDGGGDDADAADGDVADDGAEMAEADAAEEFEEAAEEMSEEAAGEVMDEAGGDDAGAEEPTASALTIPTELDVDAPIQDEDELAVLGGFLLQERNAQRLPPSPNTPCERPDEILARATLVVDGTRTPIFVAVDEANRLAYAVDTVDCRELAVAALPPGAP